MTPKRRKKSDTANLLALATAGQLDPGAVYFDSDLKKWYGAKSNTELFELSIEYADAPIGATHPIWQILDGETVSVSDRVEYAIVSGTFDNQGAIELGDGSTLIVIGG